MRPGAGWVLGCVELPSEYYVSNCEGSGCAAGGVLLGCPVSQGCVGSACGSRARLGTAEEVCADKSQASGGGLKREQESAACPWYR